MADPEILEGTPADDIDMGEEDETKLEDTMAVVTADHENVRTTFLDYLKSPMVELIIGGAGGTEKISLMAHQALLMKSPWFAERCLAFGENARSRRIELPNEDLEATGSFLEYLYNGEYFPRRLTSAKDSGLENDPSIPQPDTAGLSLLRHARIYAIAGKFGVKALQTLAHSKIHRTSATAKGEIAYARFVYGETQVDDVQIRKPVAAFWASRSHVLRHEAEEEFKSMCLEFPQFGFDVLTMVLDRVEKKEGSGPTVQAGRKRARGN